MADRIRELTLLDKKFKPIVEDIVSHLTAIEIPLHVFETIRSPARQNELYARGRDPKATDYGRIATKARAYQSAHQYGMAADMVFRVDGKWTWEEPERGMWDQYHVIARGRGLLPIKTEKPHVQLASFDWTEELAGPDDEGDWLAWLARGRR